MIATTVVIVNLNCGNDTENLLNDLDNQTNKNFEIWLFDQNSTEEASITMLEKRKTRERVTRIIKNDHNKPLNHIWNESNRESTSKLVTLLNNDIRITNTYIDHTIKAFEKNVIDIAIHPTNNKYFLKSTRLNVKVLRGMQIKHGWEMTFNREWFLRSPIPPELHFYCGDDWIFERIYNANMRIGYVLSAPILHDTSKTVRHEHNRNIVNGAILLRQDVEIYTKQFHKKIFLKANDDFSNIFKEQGINYQLRDF
jgi:GT2 family glycosyltransferase